MLPTPSGPRGQSCRCTECSGFLCTATAPTPRHPWEWNRDSAGLSKGEGTRQRAGHQSGLSFLVCSVTHNGQEKEMKQRHKGTKIRAGS